jgi:hypothetical protein
MRQGDDMTDDRIRVGIIGAGGWAKYGHIPALRSLENFEIVAVSSRQMATAEDLLNRVPSDGQGRQELLALALGYRAFALDNDALYGLMFERTTPDFVPSDASRLAGLATFQNARHPRRHLATRFHRPGG